MRFVKTTESIFDIPSGFVRVEYLQSTGTQYIDTGFVPTSDNFKYEGNMQANVGWFFGYRSVNTGTTTGDMRAMFVYPDGRMAIRYGAASDNSTLKIDSNKVYKVFFDGTSIYVNDVNFVSVSEKYNNPVYKSIYLFSANATGYYSGDMTMLNGKIYYFKIWDGDTLVRDFIPCIDPLGRPCMYDLVGKKAYYNQGTGEFSVGRQIIPVEYLESIGDEYIDTGYVPKPTSSYKCDFELTNIATTSGAWFCVFGSVESNNVVFTELFLPRASGGGDVNQVLAGNHNSTFIRENYVWAINTPYDFEMTTTDVSINGASQGSITVDSSVSCSHSIYLFARHESNDTVRYNVKAKVRDFKVLENNTLVRDFIPCKDENNVGFMFDTLSSTVYENAGTGAFVVGQNKYKMKLRLVKDNILPTGYTQVEYLESTGTQYIDTGVAGSSTLKIEMDGQKAGAGYGVYFGAGTGNNRIQAIYVNDYNSARIGDISIAQLGSDTEKFNIVVDALNKNVIYNGTSYPFAYTSALTNLNIFIFTRNEGGSFADKAKAKCWSLKIWDNNVLVRNFIPAIDPSGVPCMYDLVSRTPFYNAGTGTFTTGKPLLPVVRFPADIVPAGYKTVNYLGSDSTAYIDTGVSGSNDNLKIEMDFSYSKFYAYGYFFSNYESEQHDTTRFLLDASDNSRGLAYINTKSQNGAIYTPYNLTMNDKHSLVLTKTTCSLDGVIATNTNPPAGTANTKNIILFNRGAGSYTDKRDIGMKCWLFKIWDNNTLVRNFIPVIRLLDNKAGMWDTVTKQFYTTPVGDFITG